MNTKQGTPNYQNNKIMTTEQEDKMRDEIQEILQRNPFTWDNVEYIKNNYPQHLYKEIIGMVNTKPPTKNQIEL